MAVLNNIYPPTLPTYSEPFIIGSEGLDSDKICKIYFSLSKYNAKAEIADYVQVTVFKQNTNLSALTTSLYPCDIMLTRLSLDKDIKTDNKYYIRIFPSDIQDGFQINTYYKVQIRFIKNNIVCPVTLGEEGKPNTQKQSISTWIVQNLNNFSEWSTVCLTRGILYPHLVINNLDSSEDEEVQWKTSNVDIVGKLYFGSGEAYPVVVPDEEVPIGDNYSSYWSNYINTKETDCLQRYDIQLFDGAENLLYDSGELYTNPYSGINEINHTIKRIFKDGEHYVIKIDYTTKIGYNSSESYKILMVDEGTEKLNINFTSEEDAIRGRIKLNIASIVSDPFNGNLIIRRSCGDTNFTEWEDIANVSIRNQVLNYTWYDYTVQSGKWYKYGVQSKNGDNRGVLNIYPKELMIEFEDIFLNAEEKEICIRYNPQISSFQHVVSENKVDTIGSKYPFIKRNGNTDYKQFTISGTITRFMDNYDISDNIYDSQAELVFSKEIEPNHLEIENSLFTSKEDTYDRDVLTLYNQRMQNNNSDTFDKVIYEKDFRDKIIEFLYKNNVKLYRSATEGNILVKLMNISLTPNQILGRNIWNFSATAYEIDECSIENYDFYGIQKIGTMAILYEYLNNYVGRLNETIPAEKNVINILEDNYQKYCKQNFVASIDKLVYLKLEFQDKPYLIKVNSGTPEVASSGEEGEYVGYLATIGNDNNINTIVVGPEGIYELKNEEIKITNITFPVDTNVTIDYELVLSQEIDSKKSVSTISYKKKVGQIINIFEPQIDLVQDITRHHTQMHTTWYKQLISINGMRIEGDEGIVFYVKEADETDFQRHVLGVTESLDFYDPESVIINIYFYGKHFYELKDYDDAKLTIPYNKFIEDNNHESYSSIENINNPQYNHVYTVAGQRYIYHDNIWYEINNNNDIQCPVAALVDYYCEEVWGHYAV